MTRARQLLDSRGRRRVAITGIGVTTPAGCDLAEFTATVLAGRATAGPITRFDPAGLPTRFACEVSGFRPDRYLSGKERRRADRFAQYALCAALDALADAGTPARDPVRSGIACGSSFGGADSYTRQALACRDRGPGEVSPLTTTLLIPNSAAAFIGMKLGWHGPSATVSTACASGIDAISTGVGLVRDGRCDLVLAGATDSAGLTRLMMAAFCQSDALSTRNDDVATASRPFSVGRDGYVMGEGSAFLALEPFDHALARGARVYAEIAGSAQSTDSYHLTAPNPTGKWVTACMNNALDDAALTPADIGSVNAHGPSTPLGDAMETRALLAAFDGAPPPVTSSKGVFGHLMGASGAAEVAVAALTTHLGLVPPTAGHAELAADCQGLDVVSGEPRETGARPVLSNSFGLGGQNSCIILSPPEGT
ncbi:beta-ketoacyl-[acyl-carrier-protein] synthase family protein [Streptomyces kanamyceticus]|uniref:Beta-ketoacyl-[acyl-carrier-protein] synthase family protein n=1 Tax=Streptomyces kanamyceticus TaxID=1967 RepID=A0A5J6GNI8_STRKN|nr:beta-ketoacyl-[acyl-carrier-protein] synthase family protein [Streptomyces kanamyceticus]QEU95962.1 beta-ketoacyl-[acyl-carrier-protein] synthase family protein [Streptomyces kanamyceticus]